jgi:hypothetical protein
LALNKGPFYFKMLQKIKNIKKALFGGLAALVLASGMSCKHPSSSQPTESPKRVPITIEYTSYYTPYKCSSAEIRGDFTNWGPKPMKKVSENYFIYEDTVKEGDYLFNVESFIVQFPNFSDWVASKDSRGIPQGIRATRIKLNNALVDNSYLIDAAPYGAANLSFSISEQEISPGPGNHLDMDERIPPECACQKGYIALSVPWEYKNFSAGIAWMQTIHDNRKGGASRVHVDYTRLLARINGKDSLLASYEYDNGIFDGKGHLRYPWFITNESINIPATFENDCMIFQPSDKPDRAYHWWSPRALVPNNAEYCWLESKIKIDGNASVQAGIDFWKDLTAQWDGYNVNNTEAGVSDWYFAKYDSNDNPKWQTIKLELKK